MHLHLHRLAQARGRAAERDVQAAAGALHAHAVLRVAVAGHQDLVAVGLEQPHSAGAVHAQAVERAGRVHARLEQRAGRGRRRLGEGGRRVGGEGEGEQDAAIHAAHSRASRRAGAQSA